MPPSKRRFYQDCSCPAASFSRLWEGVTSATYFHTSGTSRHQVASGPKGTKCDCFSEPDLEAAQGFLHRKLCNRSLLGEEEEEERGRLGQNELVGSMPSSQNSRAEGLHQLLGSQGKPALSFLSLGFPSVIMMMYFSPLGLKCGCSITLNQLYRPEQAGGIHPEPLLLQITPSPPFEAFNSAVQHMQSAAALSLASRVALLLPHTSRFPA